MALSWRRLATINGVVWAEAARDGLQALRTVQLQVGFSGSRFLLLDSVSVARLARCATVIHAIFTARIVQQLESWCQRTLGFALPPWQLLRLSVRPRVVEVEDGDEQ